MMKRSAMIAGLVVAASALGGCASDYYGGGYGYSRPYYSSGYYGRGYSSSYYPGWYDGYYGTVYDGYWDRGGTYYYRTHERDRWRRDDGRHFRRGDRPGGNWQRWDRDRDHDRDHDGDHDRDRDHDWRRH